MENAGVIIRSSFKTSSALKIYDSKLTSCPPHPKVTQGDMFSHSAM